MTHAEFWELYNAGKLENVSVWRKEQEDIDPEFSSFRNEVIAFVYDGKFFLRIVQFNGYTVWWVGRGSKRHVIRDGVRTYSAIKEFDNKNAANAYFKKCAAGYAKA